MKGVVAVAELSREQLIELITQEVLRTLGDAALPEPKDTSFLPAALVIGEAEQLPKGVRGQYNLRTIDQYTGDIEQFEKVFITVLTQTQLADIALGRDSQPVTCAVSKALLMGIEVYLYDIALAHRKLAGRGSRAFYQLLEGYVRTLQSFDIKLVQGTTVIDKYVKQAAPGGELPGGVITEAAATVLLTKNQGDILLRKGAILTPSARDVFLHANRNVTYI